MQHSLDISGIEGSGRGGRITLRDVEVLIASGDPSTKPATQAQPAPDQALTNQPDDRPLIKGVGSDIVPHSKMRKRIAENMVGSLMHTAPHVTAVFEADLSAVMKHRNDHKAAFASRGTPLTLTTYFVAATITALQKVPQVNSRWFDDHLEVFHAINIGIGTALGDQGLIVPVLHHAETMNLKGIAKALTDVTERARNNQLKPEDVRGGTFTISNHGVSGSLIATPIIISQPQSAILGVGKIEKRVKVKEVDGEDMIAIRPMCYVSLTIDHRVIDGHQTNAFLTELVSTLENWS
jgi:2-oxoglutarate dehydrogenase E2 component (dihydrolipoamide succinyltransferase)